MPTNLWQKLPTVSELLDHPQLKQLRNKVSHSVVATRIRGILDELRSEVQSAAADWKIPTPAELAERISRLLAQVDDPRLRPVVNASGILLPENLGRTPLADEAIAELAAVAREYVSLEIDLATGQGSSRMATVEGLLCDLSGAEAALVVNNDAAGLLLAISALSSGRDVVVSRGELVETDGGYRIPEMVAAAGARLREVGAANKTTLDDYRQALTDQTGVLLCWHAAPFVAPPLAAPPGTAELARLAGERHVPLVCEIGAGGLCGAAENGSPGTPSAATSIKLGAHVVLASGDKLLGGPPCGILLGRREPLERIARHPLFRALRADKLTLAALAATLRLHRSPDSARREIPLLALLDTPTENLRNRAERLAPQLAACPAIAAAEALPCSARLQVGDVSAAALPSWCVALRPNDANAARLGDRLRRGMSPVIGRVDGASLLLDLRAVFPRQDQLLVEAVLALGEETAPTATASATA